MAGRSCAERHNRQDDDVGLGLPDVVHATHSGFSVTISTLDLPIEFDLVVEIANTTPRALVGRGTPVTA